jgi:hypothetical protein
VDSEQWTVNCVHCIEIEKRDDEEKSQQ